MMNAPSWSVVSALALAILSAPAAFSALPAKSAPPMLPGSAETDGRFVQFTSAAMPRSIAPSAKLTFDVSLSHLIARASAKSNSGYDEPSGWPEVFSSGGNPAATSPPGQANDPVGPVPPPPVVQPPEGVSGGSSSSGGGSPASWTPATPSGTAVPITGGETLLNPVSPPLGVPETSTVPLSPTPLPDYGTVPPPPVISDHGLAPEVQVPESGPTLLLLGLPLLIIAVLRKRVVQS